MWRFTIIVMICMYSRSYCSSNVLKVIWIRIRWGKKHLNFITIRIFQKKYIYCINKLKKKRIGKEWYYSRIIKIYEVLVTYVKSQSSWNCIHNHIKVSFISFKLVKLICIVIIIQGVLCRGDHEICMSSFINLNCDSKKWFLLKKVLKIK